MCQFSVHLTATPATDPPNKATGGKISKARISQNTVIATGEGLARIVIYELIKEKDAVGKHVSKSELYLQHPLLSEYDQHVPYFNPHLLLQPRASMPNIEALTISSGEATPPGPTVLDEVSKGRIWLILDLASGIDEVPEVRANPRLKSTLRE